MYGTALLSLAAFSVAYWLIFSIWSNRRHAKRAAQLSCKPPAKRQHRLPLGVDFVWQLVEADKAQMLPNYFHQVYTQMGKETWTQLALGTDLMVTVEPENIKALLATQFSDFEIGPQRRGNFFPAFGNGIFTSDGKAW